MQKRLFPMNEGRRRRLFSSQYKMEPSLTKKRRASKRSAWRFLYTSFSASGESDVGFCNRDWSRAAFKTDKLSSKSSGVGISALRLASSTAAAGAAVGSGQHSFSAAACASSAAWETG